MSSQPDALFPFPESLVSQMQERVQRYPQKRSAVLPMLHLVQEHYGYVSHAAMQWIAQELELKPIEVYELVTFYPMLKEQPGGRTEVRVCRTLSCALQGSEQVCKQLQHALNCPPGAPRSPDGAFSVEFVECLASCHKAPVVQVNQTLHEHVRPETVPAFVAKLQAAGDSVPCTPARDASLDL